MEQDIRIETLIVMSFAVFCVLALVAFVVPFEDTNTKLFFIGVVTALTAINVIGLFMVWQKSPTIVDEVFLMTTNGMLIKHYTRRLRPDQDEDILAGMLTAVQNFIKESFRYETGGLGKLEFGKLKMVLEHGRLIYIAAVLSGREPPELRGRLRRLIEDIERTRFDSSGLWDGNMSSFEDLRPEVQRLLDLSQG